MYVLKKDKINKFINNSYIYNCHLYIDDLIKEINMIDKKIEFLKRKKLYKNIEMLENRKISLYEKIEFEIEDIVNIKK